MGVVGKPKREYTEDDRAVALAYLAANNGNKRKTAKDCQVPRSTLQRWIDGEGISKDVPAKTEKKKGDLADIFEKMAYEALEYAGVAIGDATYLQLMTGAAIATDKMNTLRGLPSDIMQVNQLPIAIEKALDHVYADDPQPET
jgi:hypothetical protein